MAGTRSIKAGSAFITFSLRDGKIKKQLARLKGRFDKLGQSLQELGGIGVAVGAAMGATLFYPIKLAANLEAARAEFTALTGSAETAVSIISELEQFSKVALLPVDALQDAARTMLGYGVQSEKVIGITKSLTKVSRGSADRLNRLALAFGQVEAKGKLMAQEVRQFVEAGLNPLQQMSESTGQSMADLEDRMAKGAISADDVAAAFESATSEGGRFGSILDEISKTAPGLFAKFAAGAKLAIRPLGQALLPALKGILSAVIEVMPSISNFLKINAQLIIPIAAVALAALSFGAALLASGVALQVIAFALGAFMAIVGTLFSPFALISAAIAKAVVWFATATEAGQAMVQNLSNWFSGLAKIAMDTFGAISAALAKGDILLAGRVLWAGMNLIWLEGTASLRKVWINLGASIVKAWHTTWAGVQQIFNVAGGVLERGWSSTVQFIGNVFTSLGGTLEKAWNSVVAFFETTWQRLKGLFGADTADEIDRINKELEASNKAIDKRTRETMDKRVVGQNKTRTDSEKAQSARLDEIGVELANKLGNADAGSAARIKASQKELAEARRLFKEAKETALEVVAATDTQVVLTDKVLAGAGAASPGLGGGSSRGLFNTAALLSLQGGGSNSAAKTAANTAKIAKSSERTERNTREGGKMGA